MTKQIVLITGAARGIGLACAQKFSQEGYSVYLSDIKDELGKQEAEKLNQTYFHLDVTRPEDWAALDKKMPERPTVVVNNAGITGFENFPGPHDPEQISLEAWQGVMSTNAEGVMLGCQWAIKWMKEKGGSIVNLSSRSGVVGIPLASAYAASKAVVRHHSKSVALYCAGKGYPIRCNSVQPAAILTPMWEGMLAMFPDPSSGIRALSEDIPMGRMGKPEEVADLVYFLASEASSYITGAEFTIDGGVLAGERMRK